MLYWTSCLCLVYVNQSPPRDCPSGRTSASLKHLLHFKSERERETRTVFGFLQRDWFQWFQVTLFHLRMNSLLPSTTFLPNLNTGKPLNQSPGYEQFVRTQRTNSSWSRTDGETGEYALFSILSLRISHINLAHVKQESKINKFIQERKCLYT